MQDLTEVAEREKWSEIIYPKSLLDAFTVDGKVYCAPVNIHSCQWLWLSHKAFSDAGILVPTNWDEFVAAAPALEKAGKIPLAMGNQPWQSNGAFGVMLVALGGIELRAKIFEQRDAEAAAGPEMAKVFLAADKAREMSKNSKVQDWNQATNLVITGQAGGQIMGDWAQGEFAVANQLAGEDYSCLPGLGVNEVISTGGDAFYFPRLDDPEKTKAQMDLASVLVAKTTQVAFNLKKGSLPIRGDVDLSAANDCMKKGLTILASGNILPDANMLLSPDTQGQLDDLMVEFWKDMSITPENAQQRYAEIIASAD